MKSTDLTDEQIAEVLATWMGFKWRRDHWDDPRGRYVWCDDGNWNPANNIAQAFMVQEALGDGLYFHYIDCLLEVGETENNDVPYAASASARDRCLAAVKALDLKPEIAVKE